MIRRTEPDPNTYSAWSHLGFGLVMLAIGLGGPLIDRWLGEDPAPIKIADDPPVEALTWLPDAPDGWIRVRVDLPPETRTTWDDHPNMTADANAWTKIPEGEQ